MDQQQILAHTLACEPQESCGFLLSDGRYYPCENVAADPLSTFEIAPQAWIDAEQHGQSVVALVHSHPDGLPCLSSADRHMQLQMGIPWIVVCNGELHEYLPVPALAGRVFAHGSMDCYTLMRDAYHLCGIRLPEFERADNWWHTGTELYLENMSATGFYQVPADQAQPGDIFLIHLGSKAANHAAVYLGNQMILHHPPNHFSRRDPFGGFWARYLHSVWRHKQWPSFGYTAIYNDLVAALIYP